MNNSAGSAFFSDNESFTSLFTDMSEKDEINFAGGGGYGGSGKKSRGKSKSKSKSKRSYGYH